MRSARLDLALETGVLVLPSDGDLLVLRPRAGDDFSALPKGRVVVLTGFKPDHDHFAAKGYRMATSEPAGWALVCLPRAKADARSVMAKAAAMMRPGGMIVVDGQKTDGIDTFLKDCRKVGLTVAEPLAKAHGKLALVHPSADLRAWAANPTVIEGGFTTLPGVFSADSADRGSLLLAAALPAKLPARVADLGAGWGLLSRAILTREGVKDLDLVEADIDALDCARLNVPDPRAHFHWADATQFRPTRPWDAVVMNPPFHTTRAADPALGMAFLKSAQRGLTPSGTLWLVANRHLPYEKVLRGLFKQVEEIGGDTGFRVIWAAAPIRT